MKTMQLNGFTSRRGEPMQASGRLVGTVGALEVVCYQPERWDEMCSHFDRVWG